MEIIFIIIGIIAFIWISGSIIESNDKQKEEDRQNQISSLARDRLRNRKYLEQSPFVNGWSLVKLHDYRYAYVDRNGNCLNNEIYFSAVPFKNGTAIVGKSGKGFGIIRQDGTYVIPFVAIPNQLETYIEEIWEDIYLYTKTYYRKQSYVDHYEKYLILRDGRFILKQPIDEVIEIKNNFIKVRIGKRIGEINFLGQFLSRPFCTKVDLGDGLFRVRDEEYGWGIYDSNIDSIIIPCKYSEILYFKPLDIFILQPFGDGHRSFPCSIVNRKNKVIIPPKYESISILENKFIQVSYYDRKRGCGLKSGIIDLQGNEIVKPEYGHIWPSHNGFMVAEFDGRCGYVDSNGLSNLEYDSYTTVYLTQWDCSSISFSCSSFSKKESAFTESFSCKPTYLIVSKQGKYGVVDLNNNVIIPIIYDSITSVDDSDNIPGYYLVNKSSKYGVLNLKGEIIIPLRYNKICSHRVSENEFMWDNQYDFDDDSNDNNTLSQIDAEMKEYEHYLEYNKGKALYFECTNSHGETILLNIYGDYYTHPVKKDPKRVQTSIKTTIKSETPTKHIPAKNRFLFFDTETTGVPANYNAPSSDLNNWPRLVQIAWVVTDEDGKIIKGPCSEIIKPSDFVIPQDSIKVHGISQALAIKEGKELSCVLSEFSSDVKECTRIIGHNISFDIHVVSAEYLRIGRRDLSRILEFTPSFCTMKNSVNFCKIPGGFSYKYPKLSELYIKLFGSDFDNAHDACSDIVATLKCYFELKKRSVF